MLFLNICFLPAFKTNLASNLWSAQYFSAFNVNFVFVCILTIPLTKCMAVTKAMIFCRLWYISISGSFCCAYREFPNRKPAFHCWFHSERPLSAGSASASLSLLRRSSSCDTCRRCSESISCSLLRCAAFFICSCIGVLGAS